MAKITDFFRDVKVELGRVTWLTPRQTLDYTLAVVLASLIMAFFLGAFDALFTFLLNHFILQ
jgi:preprotein translocase SecE subunit